MRHCNNAPLLASAISAVLFVSAGISFCAPPPPVAPVSRPAVVRVSSPAHAIPAEVDPALVGAPFAPGQSFTGPNEDSANGSALKGHDFSRAEKQQEVHGALASEGWFSAPPSEIASLEPLPNPFAQASQSAPPPLTVDRDPVRSPDGESAPAAKRPNIEKEGNQFVLHYDVEEVVLNATVLDSGGHLVQDLKKDNFSVFEDGAKQNVISFQHTDLPVSIALVVDNSGSMAKKRPSVNKSALDLIEASNPQDEAFVVNFSDEAFIDQEFTSNINRLREGLSHIESRGGTALYDAVVASADKLAADAKRPKQVLVIITDGEDNASTLNLEQTIRRVQQLSGPVIYSIGLLFGDEMSHSEVRAARRALNLLSAETGGMAFFPKSIEQVDEIAAEVARDIRSQYTIGYHSSKPSTQPGFRHVQVDAEEQGHGKLTVRTRTGYFPSTRQPKKTTQTGSGQ
jgi:Ca-activated chloride channel homolog